MQHCNKYQNNQNLGLPSGSNILPIYWSCRASAIYDLPINLRYIHKRVPSLIITQVAFVWLFSTVHFQMCPQIACMRRCIITHVAFVWFFSVHIGNSFTEILLHGLVNPRGHHNVIWTMYGWTLHFRCVPTFIDSLPFFSIIKSWAIFIQQYANFHLYYAKTHLSQLSLNYGHI